MKVKKRLWMTLLEVLISLTLVMGILSFILFFYRQLSEINLELEKSERNHFHARYLENRLMQILPKAMGPATSPGKPQKKPYFYFYMSKDPATMFKPGTESLVFTFDNCVNLEKAFSYRVIGRLYVDPGGRLMLAKWPSPRYWKKNAPPPIKKEVLMENVDTLTFSFYTAPQTDWKPLGKNAVDQGKNLPQDIFGRWVREWNASYMRLPELVKVTIGRRVDKKKESIEFIFPFPKSPTPIIYNQI